MTPETLERAAREPESSTASPQRWRWKVDRYQQMVDWLWFEGHKVELIGGQVWEQYPDVQPYEPQPWYWTREQYYRMLGEGWFADRRVQLIDGEIYEMAAMYGPHATALTLCEDALRDVFREGWVVRAQLPLDFGDFGQPEPDVAVVRGRVRDFARAHPTTAALAVEVADSTLRFDRRVKTPLYSRAGIEEFWIVSLPRQELIVHRQPIPLLEEPFFGYARVVSLSPSQTVSPLSAPHAAIAVADLLP